MSTFFLITSWQTLSKDDPSLDSDKEDVAVEGREDDDSMVLRLKRDMHGLLNLVDLRFKEWKLGRRIGLEVVIVTVGGRERTVFYSQEEREEEAGVGATSYSSTYFIKTFHLQTLGALLVICVKQTHTRGSTQREALATQNLDSL